MVGRVDSWGRRGWWGDDEWTAGEGEGGWAKARLRQGGEGMREAMLEQRLAHLDGHESGRL